MPEPRVYAPDQRPDVEVLVDGTWYEGELRAWSLRPDGVWWGNCSWRAGPGAPTHLETFPADQIREDTVDRTPEGWLTPGG